MRNLLLASLAAVLLSACGGVQLKPDSTVPLAKAVDLARYMGDWYVIAHIPTDRDATSHNAMENYTLNADGSIATTYRNRLDGFGGKKKLLTPTAFVVPETGNALWGMRFQIPGTSIPWPAQFEYRIAHVDAPNDTAPYAQTIIARSQKDFLWLFSRSPEMSDIELARYTLLIASWGYDTSKLARVPQQWPNPVDGSAPVIGRHQ
ncbi:MAG: lipocalin family protein [Pseudomonadota bacterium]